MGFFSALDQSHHALRDYGLLFCFGEWMPTGLYTPIAWITPERPSFTVLVYSLCGGIVSTNSLEGMAGNDTRRLHMQGSIDD